MNSYQYDWLAFANVASALGMFVFAGMQFWLMRRTETLRRTERAEDRQADLTAAYGALWAECQRFQLVTKAFSGMDLIGAALSGNLDADDLLPRDWASTTHHLGKLGLETAEFGGAALAQANVTRRNIQQFLNAVEAAAPLRLGSVQARKEMALTYNPRLPGWESELKAEVMEINNLLRDALEHSPLAGQPRTTKYRAELHSQLGKAVATEIDRLSSEVDNL